MAGFDFTRCPLCEAKIGNDRLLNAAQQSLGLDDVRVAACRACLSISVARGVRVDDASAGYAWTYELLSGGGETRRFLQRIEDASGRGDLRSVHAAALEDEIDRWRLRLPEALPFLRPLFADGGELVTDTFGVPDVGVGCVVLESIDRLAKRERFVPDPEAPEERIVSPSLTGARIDVYPKGFRSKTPVFRKEGRTPSAIERAICLMAMHPIPAPGATFRLIAVPPDLMVPG